MILRLLPLRVDSPTGSFFSVLLADFAYLVLVPPYFENFHVFRGRVSPVKPEVVPALLLDANGKRINRRKHVRIRVNFSACVRQDSHADEIVECEDVSKGGVGFHSLQRYALNSLIEIAAPYSPGEAALFVPAKIKRVEALSGGQVYRYGLEYMKALPPSA